MSFDAAIARLLDVERGYVNSPADSGGETMHGITVAVARANGYAGPMRDMPISTARAIYERQYWSLMRLYDVDALMPALAEELFEAGVNVGVHRAATWLQRALNVLNRGQADYADVKVDGIIGPMTISVLRRYCIRRGAEGERVLAAALNALQGAYYIGLAEQRAKDEAHVFGWLAQRVATLQEDR